MRSNCWHQQSSYNNRVNRKIVFTHKISHKYKKVLETKLLKYRETVVQMHGITISATFN